MDLAYDTVSTEIMRSSALSRHTDHTRTLHTNTNAHLLDAYQNVSSFASQCVYIRNGKLLQFIDSQGEFDRIEFLMELFTNSLMESQSKNRHRCFVFLRFGQIKFEISIVECW